MNKNVKMALIACASAAGAAAAAAAVTYAVTKVVAAESMDREEPEIMLKLGNRIFGPSGGGDPRMAEVEAAAECLRAVEMERVEMTARDGTRLVAHWRPNENAKRVVVAMHGWRSNWAREFGASADFLREHDCAVLYPEQRGTGESGGDYIGFGLLERFDCADWVNWLNENKGTSGLPVYLLGISLGASTVMMAAGLPLPENVRGIVADCGYTSAEAIWAHVTKRNFHLSYGIHRPWVHRLSSAKLGCAPDSYSTVDAMRATKIPVLFIHGLSDGFVPPSMTLENYAACAAPGKRLLLVPDARHGMGYMVDRTRYEAEVLDFWRDCEKKD